jgi:hypothetical protein
VYLGKPCSSAVTTPLPCPLSVCPLLPCSSLPQDNTPAPCQHPRHPLQARRCGHPYQRAPPLPAEQTHVPASLSACHPQWVSVGLRAPGAADRAAPGQHRLADLVLASADTSGLPSSLHECVGTSPRYTSCLFSDLYYDLEAEEFLYLAGRGPPKLPFRLLLGAFSLPFPNGQSIVAPIKVSRPRRGGRPEDKLCPVVILVIGCRLSYSVVDPSSQLLHSKGFAAVRCDACRRVAASQGAFCSPSRCLTACDWALRPGRQTDLSAMVC